MSPSVIKLAAEAAVRGTSCTYSVAREVAQEMAEAADADGVTYDVEMLADVVADRLAEDGWIE